MTDMTIDIGDTVVYRGWQRGRVTMMREMPNVDTHEWAVMARVELDDGTLNDAWVSELSLAK